MWFASTKIPRTSSLIHSRPLTAVGDPRRAHADVCPADVTRAPSTKRMLTIIPAALQLSGFAAWRR